MGRWFTGGIHVVMAAFTSGYNAGVIESHIGPGSVGDMAIVAGGIGSHMIGRLAGGGIAVMAARTGTCDHRVVEANLQPVTGGGMTGFTRGSRGHMCRMFPSRLNSVVTRPATTSHAIMVEIVNLPTIGAMTIIT
jgi:hypothetical protein